MSVPSIPAASEVSRPVDGHHPQDGTDNSAGSNVADIDADGTLENVTSARLDEHAWSKFDVYAQAFQEFTGRTKTLVWSGGELAIAVQGGGRHPLSALSSGEEQVLIIVSELLLRWRPGSLVLIDEPELHLQPALVAEG